MLCFRKECSKNPITDLQNRKNGGNADVTYQQTESRWLKYIDNQWKHAQPLPEFHHPFLMAGRAEMAAII
jgi:hypothetical protein